MPCSNPWKRFISYLLDSLIISVPLQFIYTALGFVYKASNQQFLQTMQKAAEQNNMSPELFWQFLASLIPYAAAALVTTIIGSWLYFSVMESSSKQATLGKIVFNMIVTDGQLRRISFGKANLRFLVKYLSGLFFPIYLVIFFTQKRQALHDLAASTIVINK
jgi:uncharacterized RDD family membrane protein YckC